MKEQIREILTGLIEPFAYPTDKDWKERINPTLAIEDALASILALMPRWVSVKDRLPKQGEVVFCWKNGWQYPEMLCSEFYGDDEFYWMTKDGEDSELDPTHWQPLPAAPEVEEG